ncbi:MAG TPA: hypothetical protein VMG12_32465 [Polyangiaceae bacterium]|nr:hypothetical protein [Polyangiaceae bacterium]
MQRSRVLALSALLIACGSSREGVGGAAPFAKTLPLDEHGVRLAGGETSDLGGGDGPLEFGRDTETERLGVEQARQLGLPIEQRLGLLDAEYERPFHWQRSCPNDGAALEASDTFIHIDSEVLDVFRTRREPIPGMPSDTDCPDGIDFPSTRHARTGPRSRAARCPTRMARSMAASPPC